MGTFSGIGKAQAKKSANYIQPGQYLLRLDVTRIGKNRKGQKLAFVETTVIAVLDESSKNRVGESVTWCVREDSDYFFPEVKAFILAVGDMDENSVTEEEVEAAAATIFEGDNPLQNFVIEAHTTERISQENRPYNVTDFKGTVPFEKVKEILSEEGTVDRFFPDGLLDQLIEATANDGE